MEELLERLKRSPDSHKGENGRVGIIAGSKDYTGAPALSAKAALKTGCDLATILTSESVSSTVASYSENFVVKSYSSDYFSRKALDQALELDRKVDSIVIGPGLGDPEPIAVREFLQESNSTVIIDADALEQAPRSPIKNAVLTPHKAEFKQIENYMNTLLEKDNIVIEKGKTDTIYSKSGEKFENETGHPAMTVGGTGDILTGVIASLIAQGLNKEEAARLGVWLNGKAGEKAAEKYGNSALATDVIEEFPELFSNQG